MGDVPLALSKLLRRASSRLRHVGYRGRRVCWKECRRVMVTVDGVESGIGGLIVVIRVSRMDRNSEVCGSPEPYVLTENC